LPRWKATEQILHLNKDGEYFDDNWMNFDRISQYAPPIIEWTGDRPMRVEDVDLWEVITEMSGPVGVYGAYMPFGELYVVTSGWRIVAEFSGWNANARLEAFLIENNIPYPKAPDALTVPFESRMIVVG
jgi:hypothetical protein